MRNITSNCIQTLARSFVLLDDWPMSRPARKPPLWTLRKVSTQISQNRPRKLTRIIFFASCGFFVSGIIILYFYPPETECMQCDPSLHCLLIIGRKFYFVFMNLILADFYTSLLVINMPRCCSTDYISI